MRKRQIYGMVDAGDERKKGRKKKKRQERR